MDLRLLTRRSRALTLLGAALLLSTAGGALPTRADSIINGEFTPTPTSHKFVYMGVDDGWQDSMEAVPGREYVNAAGQNADAMRIMANSGLNAVRITVEQGQELTTPYNPNPPTNETLHQEESAYTLPYGGVDQQVDVARRARSYGMKVILTIDMGDNIAAPSLGSSYAHWATDTYTQMLADIDTETKRLLDPFLNAGVQPDIIIASNESNGGTLHFDKTNNVDRFVDDTQKLSPNGPLTISQAVFSSLATGTNTIWPKCAGYYKQAIISARSELTAKGFDVTQTRFGLHSNNGSPDSFYDRIFGPEPANYETDYYDQNGVDEGNINYNAPQNAPYVPLNILNTKLSSLVDIIGFSGYAPTPPTAGTQAAFQTAAAPLNKWLTDYSTYGLTSNLDSTGSYYTAGPFAVQTPDGHPEYAKKVLMLEFDVHTGDVGGSAVRQSNFTTYYINQLTNSSYLPFMLGALWWEGEYATFQSDRSLFSPGAYEGSYDGDQNYDGYPIFSPLALLNTWGQFGAANPNIPYSITSTQFGDTFESGPYGGSWGSMQTLIPSLFQSYQIANNNDGFFSMIENQNGDAVSPWNNSNTVGDHVEVTALSGQPNASQEWSFVPNGAGSQQIVNRANGLAVDAPNNTSVLQDTGNPAAGSQLWTLTELPRFNLVNVASGSVIDGGFGEQFSGQYTSMQALNKTNPSQEWQVIEEDDSSGYYRIVNTSITANNNGAGLVLSPYNNSKTSGDHVEVTTTASPIQAGQDWSFVPAAGGSFRIINRNSGYALDAPNNNAVLQDPVNNSSATQEWYRQPVY